MSRLNPACHTPPEATWCGEDDDPVIHRSKTLRLFTVQIDRQTGEWLGEPEEIGTVDQDAHFAKQDTDAVHLDTFERFDDNHPDGETCAIEARFA